MIFLDNNANLPIDDKTIEAYCNGAHIGNISCKTKLANKGKILVELFKKKLIDDHGTYRCIITSGGSESNSTIINHFVYNKMKHGMTPKFVCSSVEHPSITEYLIMLENDRMAEVVWIYPQWNGEIKIEEILANCEGADCIFLQSANSETGFIQNIAKLYNSIRGQIHLHVDNVQGYKKLNYPLNIGDSISVSMHKIGAPLGIGGLLYRSDFKPLIAGKQNDGLRGGTYNIGCITASLHRMSSYQYDCPKIYKKYFLTELSKHFHVYNYPEYIAAKPTLGNKCNCIVLFSDNHCLAHTLFFSIVKNGKTLCGTLTKNYMFDHGITIGTGSACNTEKSTIIGSMNSAAIDEDIKKGFLRISYGCKIVKNDLDKLISLIIKLPVNY